MLKNISYLSLLSEGSEARRCVEMDLISGPSETVAVEPRLCNSITKQKDFDAQLQFQPNYFSQTPGSRKWKVTANYGPTGIEHEYEFAVTLDSVAGFSITP